ncbi:MAG: hypothetical protein IJ218_02575 [Alphaproteobacteria bacterium]|nr:hypothetical protein [Alphaproteobacteria bacterium]
MQLSTKKNIRKWLQRLLWLFIFFGVVRLNVHRFEHNTFANYEKAVDYGRVREVKEVINPVIAAVFYAGKESPKTDVASYMNHLENYRTQNVKMAVVPQKITPESQKVLEKLYREIKKHNKISYIVLAHRQDYDIAAHEEMLRQIFLTEEIELSDMTDNVAQTEKNINAFLQEPESFVVFLSDLQKNITVPNSDMLIEEVAYLAQKNHYKIHIFDEVDTQLAKAWEEDYASWFEDNSTEESGLAQQKNNLQAYINNYGEELRKYFALNLELPKEQKAIWPQKTTENYRLFDRGYVYVRFFTSGNREVFSRAKVGKNKGIVVGAIEIARKAAIKIKQPIEKAKIYIMTDLEKIEKAENIPLVNYLETDDGVYVQYHKKIALLSADERPDTENELLTMLLQRAQISEDVALRNIEFYKFKTVEINYEN